MKAFFTLTLIFLFSISVFGQNNPSQWIGVDHKRGDNLRVLRLAVSCVGEYTSSVGGVATAEANLDAWLEEINDIYGREYCVRFELIPNNSTLIFPDANTDPWPTMPAGAGCQNSSTILNVQGTVIDNIIGAANYDISHVILGPTYGGGCAGWFTGGYSGGLDIPVTRHEMGHQFSQSHTITNGGNTNFELTGGNWSIQGGNGQGFAHAHSYHQLVNHITGTEAAAGTSVPTGNTIPSVNAGPNVAIPVGTPFILTGTASDPDNGDNLKFIWDTMDGGIDQGLPIIDESQGSLFMRLMPSNQITRIIPAMEDVLNSLTSTTTAHLTSTPRDINVKLTVNDNHQMMYNGETINASGINSDDKKIQVVDNGGPFQVTSPNTPVVYTGGSTQNITWNVNGTNLAPINTSHVNILLSSDGGTTFGYVLAANTPNDGFKPVTIPNFNTTRSRIKIEPTDNIYFDVSNSDFTINQNPALAGISADDGGSSLIVNESGQTDSYDLSLLTMPAGEVVIKVAADDQTQVSFDGVNFVDEYWWPVSNTNVQTVHVRGKYDTNTEGPHLGSVSHEVVLSLDMVDYPVGLIGQALGIMVSDAQMPPVVGVDFDEAASTDSPVNWTKLTDLRTGSLTNLPIEDGTPTGISLTTSAANCGNGGCGFDFSFGFSLPEHVQSLLPVNGVSYAKGTVTFDWAGLKNNTDYRVFLIGQGVFGPIDQDVVITGAGTPVAFSQTDDTGITYINGQVVSTDPLTNFGDVVTSTGTGTINVTVTTPLTEMAFLGTAIQEVPGPPTGHCPPNHNLSGSLTMTQTFESNGAITSSHNISGNYTIIKYDSSDGITLSPGFEVGPNVIFSVTNDGCTN